MLCTYIIKTWINLFYVTLWNELFSILFVCKRGFNKNEKNIKDNQYYSFFSQNNIILFSYKYTDDRPNEFFHIKIFNNIYLLNMFVFQANSLIRFTLYKYYFQLILIFFSYRLLSTKPNNNRIYKTKFHRLIDHNNKVINIFF